MLAHLIPRGPGPIIAEALFVVGVCAGLGARWLHQRGRGRPVVFAVGGVAVVSLVLAAVTPFFVQPA